jgi:putative acetyltransferase
VGPLPKPERRGTDREAPVRRDETATVTDERSDEIAVRAETPADAASIRTVVREAFGSDAEADLVDAIRRSPGWIPELSLVETVDGDVVGHVLVSHATLVTPTGDRRDVAMLSPLAVAPRHHRRGIGAALVRAVTALADARGEPLVVLEGSPAYYARFGFEHAAPLGIVLPLPSWAPSEAGQVLRLAAYDPALTGSVEYPAAFDGVIEH